MRKLTTILTSILILATAALTWAPTAARAEESGGNKDIRWDVDTDGDTGGPDATAKLWLGSKNGQQGQGGQDTYNRVGKETPAEFTARMRAYYDQQAAYCNRMFTDVQSRALMTDAGSIALRNTYLLQCLTPGMSVTDAPSPPPNPAVLGAEAVAQLTLPDATPKFGPDPSVNKWNMLAVGFPIWLWTDGQTQLTSSASVRGYTVTLVATRTLVQFSMGDGTTVSCTATAAYTPAVKPGTPSPNCGHVYQLKPDSGSYRVAALASWNVTWSVLGQSGTIPITKGAARQLPIGELQAVVVR